MEVDFRRLDVPAQLAAVKAARAKRRKLKFFRHLDEKAVTAKGFAAELEALGLDLELDISLRGECGYH